MYSFGDHVPYRAFPVYASETSQVAIELDAETDGAEEYFPGSTAGYRLTLKNKLGPPGYGKLSSIFQKRPECPFFR